MSIHNLPDDLLGNKNVASQELNIFNYEVYQNADKNKINLNKNVLSFLLEGEKGVHFSGSVVSINDSQSMFIASGNFLMTEHIGSTHFRCLLFFFSQKNVNDFLLKHAHLQGKPVVDKKGNGTPYFLIQKDSFVTHFINSLSQSFNLQASISQRILELKFEEIMLYLANKYKQDFFSYLYSLLVDERELSLKTIVEKNLYTNLSIEEIAFLCNMSLSTFKRKFVSIYDMPPGKWFQQKRLTKAKELLLNASTKPSEIFMDFGYDSLSNFSAAFKKEFGYSPKETHSI